MPCPARNTTISLSDVAIAAFPWGKYLGDDALTKGVAVKISSWWRFAPNTLPAMSKAAANYMNSQLIRMEAEINGYQEGIALDDAPWSLGAVARSGEPALITLSDRLRPPGIGFGVVRDRRNSSAARRQNDRCPSHRSRGREAHRR